jgi:DNA-binding NarL/FixJ family response regulator
MADATASGTHGTAIRILAADSNAMNSQLLADALARDKRFEVCGPFTSSKEVLAAVGRQLPHVALISTHLDDGGTPSFDLVRELRSTFPKTRVVMLLDSSDRPSVIEAFRAGVKGVFCRTQSLKSLLKCIESVHQGQVWANSAELQFLLEALAETIPNRFLGANHSALLSKREQEVVRCVAGGMTNREIAQCLKLTEHTVKNYLFRIFDKLGVSSRVELALYALSAGPSTREVEAEPTPVSARPSVEVGRAAAPAERRDPRPMMLEKSARSAR